MSTHQRMGFASSTFPVTVEQCQGPRSKGIAQDSAGSSSAACKQLHVHDKHVYQELVGFAVSGHEVPDFLPLNNRVKNEESIPVLSVGARSRVCVPVTAVLGY